MSITLINTPPLFAFSSDLISLKFQSDSHLSQSERSAVNRLQIQFPLTQQGILLQYGTKSIQLNVTNDADIDGTSFPQSFTQAQQIVDVINRNYDLSNDFEIDATSSGLITFTAKKKAYGFDFIPRVSGKFTTSNTVTGRPSMLKTNYSIKFALFIENINNDGFERIYDQSLMVNTDGHAELSLLDKVHDRMMDDLRKGFTDVPGADPIVCKKSCRKYYYTFAESYGATPKVYLSQTSDRYTALNGGLSYIKQFNSSLQQLIAPGLPEEDRFLKQGNNEIYTRSNQPQYLYFFNTRADYPAAQLMVKWYFKDETESSAIVYTADIDELRKYAFNVQFDSIFKQDLFPDKSVVKYDIWLQDSSGAQISEKRVYHLNYQYREYVRYFLSWSSFGSFDSRVCYGNGNGEFELFQNQAQRILKMGYDIKDGNSLVFDVKLKSKYKVATGWLTRKELIGNRDFFLSAFKFRFSGGLLLPIKIDNNNIPEIEDGNNLFSQFFEYSYLFDDHSYSEGDNDEPGISSGDFFFSYGPVGSDPSGGFHETDPTVPFWVKAITLHEINKWNSLIEFEGNFYTKNEIDLLLGEMTESDTLQSVTDRGKTSTHILEVEGLEASGVLSIPSTSPTSPKADKTYLHFGSLGQGSEQPPSGAQSLNELDDVDSNLSPNTPSSAGSTPTFLGWNNQTNKWEARQGNYIPMSQKGQPNGVATLGTDGILSTQERPPSELNWDEVQW